MNTLSNGYLILISVILFWVAVLFGEIKCIYKVFQCDFKAPYKAEIIYGASALTGIGAVVGYFNIEDK